MVSHCGADGTGPRKQTHSWIAWPLWCYNDHQSPNPFASLKAERVKTAIEAEAGNRGATHITQHKPAQPAPYLIPPELARTGSPDPECFGVCWHVRLGGLTTPHTMYDDGEGEWGSNLH